MLAALAANPVTDRAAFLRGFARSANSAAACRTWVPAVLVIMAVDLAKNATYSEALARRSHNWIFREGHEH